ncbi:hypothetical protein B0J11DRAFT_534071, partial [Dendryphion nanum]
SLYLSIVSDSFDNARVEPLLDAVLNKQPDEVIWDAVYDAVTESTPSPRIHVDKVLKEELGHMYVDVAGFSEALFGEVSGLGPAAQAAFDKCKEGDNPLYLDNAWRGWPEEAKEPDVLSWLALRIAQLADFAKEHKLPVQGSTALQKLDIGELKSNPQADKEVLAAQDSRRFVLGFTLCGPLMRLWLFDRLGGIASTQFDIHEDCLQFLGFDPTIIERNNSKERLVIDKVIRRVSSVAGRATTYSWQYPERGKEVVNVARYYYHETVRVGGQDDDIRGNVRKCSMAPPSRSSSVAGQKRSSSCTHAPLPPSKRPCSSSPTKRSTANPSSLTSLLAVLEGCIEGYESLYTQAGILQGDISPNNLMVNEDVENPSWPASLIDLDLAIKVPREKASAIGVLLDDENHSFMHDMESFFWVLFWICIHYDGPGKYRKLAELKKGLISDERDFLDTVNAKFTPYYMPLGSCVNRLRRELPAEMREILRTAQGESKGLEK